MLKIWSDREAKILKVHTQHLKSHLHLASEVYIRCRGISIADLLYFSPKELEVFLIRLKGIENVSIE